MAANGTISEMYRSETQQTAVTYSQSKIEAVRRTLVASTGLRLYRDGCIGVAGGLGAVDQDSLRTAASAALDREIPYPGTPGSNLTRHGTESGEGLPGPDAFVAEIEAILEHLRTQHPGFIFSNVATRTTSSTSLTNNQGLDLSHRVHWYEVALVFKEKQSANILDGGMAVQHRRYDRRALLEYADMFVAAYQERAELPTGRVPVAFLDTDTLPILKLARDLHGLRFGSGASALSEKRGEQVFSSAFTLYQSRRHEDTFGPFFDAEGVVNPDDRVALIEHGVVTCPYTDKKIASRFDLPLTGAASAEYDAVPGLEFPGFTIAPSQKSAAALLGGRPAILLAVASGGDFTPSGEFGTPVQLAYLYDGTRLVARLPEFRLSGNVYKMFGDDFIGVSADTVHPASRDRLLLMEMEVS